MFTIEWATIEYSPRWKTSTLLFAAHEDAANSAADWMTSNHEHGVEIQVRVVTVEITHTLGMAA